MFLHKVSDSGEGSLIGFYPLLSHPSFYSFSFMSAGQGWGAPKHVRVLRARAPWLHPAPLVSVLFRKQHPFMPILAQ